jgi:hypothetical protein
MMIIIIHLIDSIIMRCIKKNYMIVSMYFIISNQYILFNLKLIKKNY